MFLSYPDKSRLLCLHSAWQKRSSSSPGFPYSYCIAKTRHSFRTDVGLDTAHCCNPPLFTTSVSANNNGTASLRVLLFFLANLFPVVKSKMVITQRVAKADENGSSMRGKKTTKATTTKININTTVSFKGSHLPAKYY